MRDYSKVSSAFWTGRSGKSMRGDMQTQIVALYLMTCPHSNMIGVFHCPLIYISHETGSSLEGASKGLKTLSEGEFCTYDEETEIVWVHEMAKYQIGEQLSANDNQVKSIIKQYMTIPVSLIQQGFYDRYKHDYHLPKLDEEGKPLGRGLEAPPKPGTGTGTGTEEEHVPGAAVDACPHQDIITLYATHLPMLPQVQVWGDARQKLLRTRWREEAKRQNLAFWEKLFKYIARSDFLTGKSSAWQADLEWILGAKNFIKILEGNYENKAAS